MSRYKNKMNSARSHVSQRNNFALITNSDKKSVSGLRNILNTSRANRDKQDLMELSPKHALMSTYYKEKDLIKNAKHYSIKSNRFSTNLFDNKSLITNTLQNRSI